MSNYRWFILECGVASSLVSVILLLFNLLLLQPLHYLLNYFIDTQHVVLRLL
jgi:hypothetical protein